MSLVYSEDILIARLLLAAGFHSENFTWRGGGGGKRCQGWECYHVGRGGLRTFSPGKFIGF